MKLNENIKIVGKKVMLIPYEAKHVKKYHEWMKNPELQELTASQPLSLDEEYDMQRTWRIDEDKCTFLILSKDIYVNTSNEIESLIGDTNLFLSVCEDTGKLAEAEIMIAEKHCRGQHLGWEAMLLMLKYGQQELKVDKFIVKIGEANQSSIKMFLKIGFVETSRSSVFKEITFEKVLTYDWILWLNEQIKYTIEEYTINTK